MKYFSKKLISAKKSIKNVNYYINAIEETKKEQKKIGNLLSSLTLFSPLKCLTSLFGMGRGVSTLLSSPIKCIIP